MGTIIRNYKVKHSIYIRMKNQNNFIKTLPVFMAFYVMGFPDIIGTATSYVKLEFGLTDTLTQGLTTMVFIWFALLSIPVGVFQNKYSKKLTANLGILFIAVGMLVPILSYSFYGMIVSFILMGIGNTVIQVSANPLMQDVSAPEKLSRNLTLSQFVKAIAGMAGPIIAAFCAKWIGNWTIVYWVYLIISIITVIWLRATPIRETKNIKGASILSSLSLLKDRRIALLVLGTFLMVGFDVGMNTNIVGYLKRFGVTHEEANVGISIYFAALMVGRFLSALILNKVPGSRMLFYCAIISVAAFISMYIMPGYISGYIAIFCVGLFTAAIFPLIFSTGLQYMPERSNELSGLMIMSVCGGGVIPPIIGLISDNFGLMAGLLLLGLCLAYVIFLSLYIQSNKILKRL